MAGLCKNAKAQEGHILQYEIENGDTLFLISMKPLYIFPLPKPGSKEYNSKRWKEYRRLVYNFGKVYPYALKAKERTNEVDRQLARMAASQEREAFVKQFEKDLFAEFEAPVRKLTFSQGKLLLKLVDREVGQTSYYVIKDLKGGFTAFFWQGVARLFGANLKKPYDKYGEDREVEKLVKLYESGSFDMLYYQLFGTVSELAAYAR
jgi:hypothetical protein